jgi:hypothetical protein
MYITEEELKRGLQLIIVIYLELRNDETPELLNTNAKQPL